MSKIITIPQVNAVLQYLAGRPYAEVVNLITTLRDLPDGAVLPQKPKPDGKVETKG